MPPVKPQWRSLEELAQDAQFLSRVEQEFPGLVASISAPRDRRQALALMAASLALAGVGLGGCNGAPEGRLIPAVRSPPGIVPGTPDYYSSAHVEGGYAAGTVIKHFMGRPIKVEGNPFHPASLGATSPMAQAELLNFYDPRRSWGVTRANLPQSRSALEQALAEQRARLATTGGAGFVILTGASTSPTLAAQLDALRKSYPQIRWLHWEPIGRENVEKGFALAYGARLELKLQIQNADVILAIDSDLLSAAPGHLNFAREFASRRNPTRAKMNRLYAIEATPSLIAAVADERFIAGPQDSHRVLRALAGALLDAEPVEGPPWLDRIVSDLKANRGRAFIHLGPDHPPEAHALVCAMNEALGGRGTVYTLLEAATHASSDDSLSLSALIPDMRADRISSLLIIDSNPVYAAPGALDFAEALRQVDFSLCLSATPNETTDASLWAVPMAHPWEGWSDARAFDGTATVMQPQALPLYQGLEPHDLLGLLLRPDPPKSLDLIRETWRVPLGAKDAWIDALANGVVPDSIGPVSNRPLSNAVARIRPPEPPSATPVLLFRPDPYLLDGRYADNPWLQELPRPLTKISWGNPLQISPKRAREMLLHDGDVVRIAVDGAHTKAPIIIAPGQSDDCIVALLGFGRSHAGPVGQNIGVDFFKLMGRSCCAPDVQKTNAREELASTQHHANMFDEQGVYARSGALAQFLADPNFARRNEEPQPSFYEWKPQGPAAWGMSIDLNACIGCKACVVACQAENNIPVVGKEEILREREMYWLRIDRYYDGPPESPKVSFQPVLCMHCEEAPCEPVCPVGATLHDAEGLNVMVYNRCVGTRFCSNNCPYKVRRFNYFDFAGEERRAIESRNPDVTVRARGVMEKCTFCLQRIAAARIVADREGEKASAVTTACEAACPTRAFTFGDLAEKGSEVAARRAGPLSYALLADQNTKPRVTYEARVLNVDEPKETKK
ncbi:TAT-variant-translocated molybdopterin oxidoreductase [Methylocystis sp. B8]|uniref:TAT-variant-translocated molybdopterin oxidoreductase n=1 Tax=Methylocystis sp. B8 TaxID=544938 RepID=UPI0010FEB53C|nr:TAT-variant-translocated molybdopterin oxidoreductase [Methylocystis sp. B8]TLG73702.1 4Fe-4S dicluster domain-containing protein [Methylocystis sp. B8]